MLKNQAMAKNNNGTRYQQDFICRPESFVHTAVRSHGLHSRCSALPAAGDNVRTNLEFVFHCDGYFNLYVQYLYSKYEKFTL